MLFSRIDSIVLLLLLVNAACALQCMNCTSSSLAQIPGCHHQLSKEHLIKCGKESTHCRVVRYEGSYGSAALVKYERSCANSFSEECRLIDEKDYDGVECSFTCTNDGCNAINVFPNEPEFSTFSTPTANTHLPTKLLRCYSCVSDLYNPAKCTYALMEDDLVKCPIKKKYCSITAATNIDDGIEYTTYTRSCSGRAASGCSNFGSGKICTYSCATDGCNNLPQLPEGSDILIEKDVKATDRPIISTSGCISFCVNMLLFLIALWTTYIVA